jgi:hypothetical protein
MACFHRRSEAWTSSTHNAGHSSYASLQGKMQGIKRPTKAHTVIEDVRSKYDTWINGTRKEQGAHEFVENHFLDKITEQQRTM